MSDGPCHSFSPRGLALSTPAQAGMVESEVSNMRGHIVGRSVRAEVVDSSACLHSCVMSLSLSLSLSIPFPCQSLQISPKDTSHVTFCNALSSCLEFEIGVGRCEKGRWQSEFWCHPGIIHHHHHLLSTARSSCIALFLLCSIFL